VDGLYAELRPVHVKTVTPGILAREPVKLRKFLIVEKVVPYPVERPNNLR
jgi:hypothetical protein